MAPPTKVQIQALKDDAKMWGGGDGSMAHTMSQAHTAAQNVVVPFPNVASDLAGSYKTAHSKIVTLLAGGQKTFNGLSKALTMAANVYEGTDTENAEKVHNSWKPE